MARSSDIVLVTGVSGFVGSAVARVLAGRGFAVRGLVRASSLRANLKNFPGEIVEGDARDPAAMMRATTGARYLFHVAADYRLWARDPGEIERNNLASTSAAMDAAIAAGVERVIYTSSVATLKPLPGGAADETRTLAADDAIGAYKRSKVAAERLVERMIAERGLPAVIVNPSTPIGPRDARPTPTGRIIIEAARGRMPAYVESGLNLVHVDDVAAGHIGALDNGRIGERYILGGTDVGLAAMLRHIAILTGRRPPAFALPRAPLMPLAWVNESLARVTGKEPFLTRDGLKMARHRMFYTSAKAEAELGYRARPWQDGVSGALDWFRAAGMIG